MKTAAFEITFMTIPVVVGAIILGPSAGAILGGAFGITSFIQCFGLSPFGTALFAINPFFTAFTCIVPRVLMGFLAGVIFKVLINHDKTKILSFGIASLSGAVLNTIFFMASLMIFFGNSELIQGLRKEGQNVLAVITSYSIHYTKLYELILQFCHKGKQAHIKFKV